jgi:hypothetical protein
LKKVDSASNVGAHVRTFAVPDPAIVDRNEGTPRSADVEESELPVAHAVLRTDNDQHAPLCRTSCTAQYPDERFAPKSNVTQFHYYAVGLAGLTGILCILLRRRSPGCGG